MLIHTRANNAALASLVANIAAADGDYPTAIPALTIYRRNAVTAPMPCIYGLGLGLTVQGESGSRSAMRSSTTGLASR